MLESTCKQPDISYGLRGRYFLNSSRSFGVTDSNDLIGNESAHLRLVDYK